MGSRGSIYDATADSAASDAFTVSFTSFSLILLAFFIFLDAISVTDTVRQSQVVESLGGQFVYGDRPAEPTPAAIIDIAREAAFEVVRQDDTFIITIPGGQLFESGDDRIRPEEIPVLIALADKIAGQKLSVRIEGHTDDVPISTSRFSSNWELSAARAVSVLRLFLSRGIPPERLAAAGRAEFVPAVPNLDETSRANNRRVVLIISASDKQRRNPR